MDHRKRVRRITQKRAFVSSVLPVLLLLSLSLLMGGCVTLAEPTPEPWATITDRVELPEVAPGLEAVAFESRRSL